MHLCDFNIINLRCISHASVELHKNINLIVGKNGSGKTSFLEGIYLLATGKNFSAAKRLDLIRDGSCSLGLAGLFVSDCGLESKIKLEKSNQIIEPVTCIKLLPGERNDQYFVEDSIIVIINTPSIKGDKYF